LGDSKEITLKQLYAFVNKKGWEAFHSQPFF